METMYAIGIKKWKYAEIKLEMHKESIIFQKKSDKNRWMEEKYC